MAAMVSMAGASELFDATFDYWRQAALLSRNLLIGELRDSRALRCALNRDSADVA
jgi:hypothetical protein